MVEQDLVPKLANFVNNSIETASKFTKNTLLSIKLLGALASNDIAAEVIL